MRYILYTGTANTRVITAAEWRKAHVADQDKVVWNAANGYLVRGEDLTDQAYHILLADVGMLPFEADSEAEALEFIEGYKASKRAEFGVRLSEPFDRTEADEDPSGAKPVNAGFVEDPTE